MLAELAPRSRGKIHGPRVGRWLEMRQMHADFDWLPQPQAELLVRELQDAALQTSPTLNRFAERLLAETGTRLVDWLDHLSASADPLLDQRLSEAGFERVEDAGAPQATIWEHPLGLLPNICLHSQAGSGLAIRAESVSDFLAAHAGVDATEIQGSPGASLRTACVCIENETDFCVVERHGHRGYEPLQADLDLQSLLTQHEVALAGRQRVWEDPLQGFDHTDQLVRSAQDDLGVARTADLFFQTERAFWQNRNRAARVQKHRQDLLGLGWANHDHHTYRSSRRYFSRLIQSLEVLGCRCRERFHAGQSAGWGAQVLEHPDCGVVVFADLDLTGAESGQDFAHDPLPESGELHTVGLWCGLHGEAFLEAGLHHLECQFDFDAVREQLHACGVETMRPFTDWPFLKQAFTEGERWTVRTERLNALMQAGLITQQQADVFADQGAVGSHLEVLQRDQGYKGFNRSGISEIITRTDPRGGKG